MKLNATLQFRPAHWAACICYLLLTLIFSNSYAQTRIYANTATVKSNVVDDASNATNSNNTFATVRSYGGAALGIGRYSGELELKFPTDIPANTTTFIRLNFDADVLNALLGGNLGGLLADVAGTVVLGNHSFEVGARNSSGTTILSGTSSSSFANDNLRLIKDASGFFYIAITPNQVYDRVYVKDITNALLLGANNQTTVYYAFYTSGIDPCATAFATGYEGSGLTVDVLGLGKAGVTNPEFAIDANTTNFSEISLGALGVAGSISQNIYFSTLSNTGDEFAIRMRVNPALVSAGLLGNTVVTAYNGNTQVFSQNLSSLLSLDLLGLLNAGQITSIPFAPGVAFNRVKITLNSLLNVGLTQTINLYSVISSAPRPTFTAPNSSTVNICYNTTASLGATTANTNELLWYESLEGGTALATTAYNGTFTTPALTANKTYYVSARRLGCTAESIRVPVTVVVNPQIVLGATTLNNATVGTAYSKQINAATGGTAPYAYALAAGSTLPAGLVMSAGGQIGGTPTVAGDYNFSITVTDSQGCTATTAYTLKVTATLVLPGATLPNGTVGTAYPTQTIPAANGGSTPYTYTATNLPPGLSFNPATREITGTPTTDGNYVVNVMVTDADGNITTTNYNIAIKPPLVLATTALADGTVGTSYSTQTLPPATGGTGPYTYSIANLPQGLSFDPITRQVTGTPTTSGTFTPVLTATDAEGRTTTANYSIRVLNPLSLAGQTLPNGTVGTTYPTQTLPTATGGVGPYTYVATNVPPGLSFNPANNQLTGTPTQSGNYSINLTATDAEGRTISNTYALQVIGTLSLPTQTLPDGTVGTAYPTQTLPAVSGGTAPYTYVAANVPPGLSFNTTTREITGTPTQGGTYTITLTATDANGNVVNTDYTIRVNVTAPVVANATICSGTTAVLQVSNLQAGVTYNWYGPTGTTPLATNNNGTFTTPVVTATTTFYVEAVSGTGVSTKTSVVVSINPAPNLPVITTNNQIINSGQSTVLQATADAGDVINWYGAATGGSPLGTGPSFTTPNLTTTTTYYAETVNSNGCVSASRAPVTVTVLTGPGNPNCNAANSQNSGITGICVLCSISGPANSTDTDPNNFTRITLAVGAGATGYQRLIFPGAGTATDSIRLDLATPTGLLDLSVLNGITINVMNGATVVNTYQLNSALIDLRLLGGNRFNATFAAGGVYDRVEVRFSATVAALSSLDIYGATVVYPNPTVATTGQQICTGSSTTLSATPNGGTTLTWYSAASGGTVLANGNTYTTPFLNATTTYYIEVSKAGCANAARIPVTVTVTPTLAVPVVASVPSSCAGSTSTLTVSNPDPAVTYNWYEAANGGTAIFSGTSFRTPALNATKTYYVEASRNGCVSASRAAVTVTVNPRPIAPTVQASASTINSGQSAVLTASSSEGNVVFNWYATANATTPLYTGDTYVTPPLTATTSYFVESTNTLTGCSSATRVQVTVTVNPGTPNAVPCEAPISQVNGVSGIALLAGVSNPELAIDNDTQTGSTLVMPIGAVGASVYQRLTFNHLSNIGDTVRVLINSPGRLLSAVLLGNVQLTTFNAGNSNNDAIATNNALVNVQLLSGDTQALLTFVPAAQFNAVEVRLNSGLLGALTSLNVNYAQLVLAAPQVTSSNVTACAGQTAVLTVQNPKGNLVYKWYDNAGVYQTGQDGITFTTPVLTADTRYFVAASSASGCVGARTAVNVTVTPLAAVPELLFPTVNTCAGNDVVLQVKNPVVGVTYKWYDAANVYQVGKDGTSFTVSAVLANTTYSVEAVNSCGAPSARATATINVGSVDTPIITPAATSVTAGTPAVLTASSSTAGAVFNWYDAAAPATLLYTGATFTTPPLSATKTYQVEAVVPGICPTSGRASVTVTVVPNGTPGTVPCGGATVALADGVTGIALGAGVFNAGLAVDGQTETGSSLVMPIGAVGASVFQRIGFTGLSTVGDTLRVKISSPAKLLSLGVLPTLTVTTYNGAVSNADGMVVTNPLINLELLSDNSAIILTYVPTLPFDGVEVRLNSGLLGALTAVNFDYAQRINQAPSVVSSTASTCVGSSAALTVQNPKAGVVYKWYLENTYQADGVTFNTPTNLAAGTYNFYVKAAANGCESAPTKVVVTVIGAPAPPIPVSGNPTKACLNTPVTLSVQTVAGVSYNWYDVNGTVLALNNSSYTTSASLAPGSYDFFVEAVNGSGCANASRTKITILINPSATANDIQVAGATAVCSASATTLTASSSTVTNPIFVWYSDAALTNMVFAGAAFTTPAISTTTTYYVTVSGDNKCANTFGNAKPVTITVNPQATASDLNLAGVSTICSGSTVTLTASSTTVADPVFTWYRNATLTDVAFTGAVFTSPALSSSTTYYVTVKGTNKCENAPANAQPITITVNSLATSSDIVVSGNTEVCTGSGTTLTASSTTVTNPVFTWYSDAALTQVVFTGAVFTTPALSANTNYYVTVKGDNKCESTASAKIVTVTVKSVATAADITLSNTQICAGNVATLMASSFTVTNPVFTWYNDASLTSVAYVGPTFVVSSLTNTTTFYVTVSGTNKCANSPANAKVVTVTVNPLAIASDVVITGPNNICQGSTATFTATSPTVTNPIFTWYADAALTNAIFTGSSFVSPVLNANATYYVTVRGDNRCENTPALARVITVTVNPRPNNPVLASSGTNICAGDPTTLTVQNPQAGINYEWYSAATGGSLLFTGTSFTTSVLNANTDYFVQAVSATGCGNASGRVRITVNVTPRPAVPTVAANNLNVCIGNTASLNVTNPIVGVIYSWFTSSTGGTAVATGTSFTTPSITSNVTYYVQANSGTCSSTARTAVAIVALPVPIAPASVTPANTQICAGSTSVLTVNNPDANLVYRWYSSSAGGTMLAEGNTFTTPALNATTTYYVESVTKTGGCPSNTRTSVTVTVLPVLGTPVVRVDATTSNSITFAWNAIAGATGYEVSTNNGNTWQLPTGGATGTTFVATGLQPGQKVTVVVRAKGVIDCQTSANAIPVTGTSANPFENQLYIPNTFTPNGDGKNDIFYAYGNLVNQFRMRVYNQWGEFYFESLSLNTGWDGRYRGVLQPNGVYVYYVDVTFSDGTTKQYKGTVTLLR